MSIKPEAYIHLSEDQTTLTFFYDAFRTYRYGTTWGIEEKKKESEQSPPAWTGDWNSPNTTVLTVVFDASVRDFCPTTTAQWFYYLKSLKNIEGFEHLNTSQVTDMEEMFRYCSSLRALDLSRFDTSKVKDMSWMFSRCSSLTSLDLSRFDTSKVADMSCMFFDCESLTTLDLSRFDTSKVKDMSRMFCGCSSLTTLDLTSFDTSKVVDMSSMFSRCSSLTTLDLSRFDTSKVNDMSWMFFGCSSLTTLDLSRFYTSKVNDMREMFFGCSSLTALDLSSFYTSKVMDMRMMFFDCSSLTYLDLSSFDTSKVKYMMKMFLGCSSLTALNLSSFDTSKVAEMNELFSSCRQLKSISLGKIQLQKGAKLKEVFHNCPSLTQITCYPNSQFKDLKQLFEYCALLENVVDYHQLYSLLRRNKADNIKIPFQAPISSMLEAYVVQSEDQTTLTFYYDKKRFSHPTHSWSIYECSRNSHTWQYIGATTLKVIFTASFKNFHPTSTANWFAGFESFKHIEGLERLDTSQVTDMRSMFSGCKSLSTLDLSSFDTSKVTSMSWMFLGCSSLSTLDLSGFDTSWVMDMDGMFSGCSSLTTIYSNSSWSCIYSNDMFSGCNSLRGAATNVGKSFDVSMANPGRGYFTRKVLSQEDESYVHLSADKKILITFTPSKSTSLRDDSRPYGCSLGGIFIL